MEWMTGGEALVRSLKANGVRVVFGLPGVQLYGVMTALRDEPSIRFIQTRNEQATTYMADGYARSSGQVGVALVVPGQGILNASAGLSTAFAASSPVLLIAGQVPRALIGKKTGQLHEIEDQQGAIASVTKWRARATEVEEVPPMVRNAFTQLLSGRPRPVEIEMPPETMEDEGEAELLGAAPQGRAAASAEAIAQAAQALAGAKKPLIYAGGGAVGAGAGAALMALAEHLQAGIATTPEGKGAVDERSDLSLGSAVFASSPLNAYVADCDVVLAVGTRLLRAPFSPEQQVIQLDVDEEEIGRARPNVVPLLGDARLTLEALAQEIRSAGPARPSRADERARLREAVRAADVTEPQSAITSSLRAGTPDDAIVIAGMTQIGYYSRSFWPAYAPRTYLTSSYSGNLGFEWPTALGAKVANPDRPVIAMVGDGGFLYNANELATAVQHGINAVAVVFNDGAYGNVARDLDEAWGGSYGSELKNPDFVKLAEAYGALGLRASEPTEVGRLVQEAIQANRPAIVEVPVPRMSRPPTFAPGRKPVRRN
ncbi:MAG: thiamine pyrophosphate-dependent enzyme [Chloroflexota bacterium]